MYIRKAVSKKLNLRKGLSEMKFLLKYIKEHAYVPVIEKYNLIIANRILRRIEHATSRHSCIYWEKGFHLDTFGDGVTMTQFACESKYGFHLDILGEHVVFRRKRRVKKFSFVSTYQYYREMTRCMYSTHGKKRNMCWLMYDSFVGKERAEKIALIISCVFSRRVVTRKFGPYPYGDNSDIYGVCNLNYRDSLPVAGLMTDTHILFHRDFKRKNNGFCLKPYVEQIDDISIDGEVLSEGNAEYYSESDETNKSVASI